MQGPAHCLGKSPDPVKLTQMLQLDTVKVPVDVNVVCHLQIQAFEEASH